MGELEPRPDRAPEKFNDGTSGSRAPDFLGRQQLEYGSRDTASWGNWDARVLEQLRASGLAPTRLDVGTAGYLGVMRRPSGLYYGKREGWYCGTEVSGRHVFVRIDARQSLEARNGSNRQFTSLGDWNITTRVWPLGEGQRKAWKDETDSVPLATDATDPSSQAAKTRALNMPEQFKSVLMGIPASMQQFVLSGVRYETEPWGSAVAWGWDKHTVCNHPSWCERVYLAVVDPDVVLVLDVEKHGGRSWRGWTCRWQTQEDSSAYRAAIGRHTAGGSALER